MDVGIQRRGAGPGEEKSILRARGKKSYDDDDGPEEKFISTPFMRNSEILRRDRARSRALAKVNEFFRSPEKFQAEIDQSDCAEGIITLG